MIAIFLDADACPVKDEVYVVATRYGLPVALVANSSMHVPPGFGVQLIVAHVIMNVLDDLSQREIKQEQDMQGNPIKPA